MRVGWKGTSHDPKLASFRYRVRDPAAALSRMGHDVEVFAPERADSYDQIVFCKAYTAADRGIARRVKARGGRVVFDICDNHLYNPTDHPRYRDVAVEMGEMIALADRVICSTPALGRVVSDAFGCDVVCVPDAVEVHATASVPAAGPLRLLWYGSHGSPNAPAGMADLRLIRRELEALARRRAVRLTVCSNNRAKFEELIAPFALPTAYIEWTLDGFGAVLAAADAVVLPASLNPFTACKTHNRLTTALYAGAPVIATGIESYRAFEAFCTLDDWPGGLARVADDNAAERKRAETARATLDRDWTLDVIAPQWEQALGLTPAPRRSVLAGARYHGRLDAVAEGAVTGWVHAPAFPDIQPVVVLTIGGRAVARCRADLPRPDLAAAGMPAAIGFSLPLPTDPAVDADLQVRIEGGDYTFADTPIVLWRGGARVAAPTPRALLHRPPRARPDQRAAIADELRLKRRRLQSMSLPHAQAEQVRREAAMALLRDAAVPALADARASEPRSMEAAPLVTA